MQQSINETTGFNVLDAQSGALFHIICIKHQKTKNGCVKTSGNFICPLIKLWETVRHLYTGLFDVYSSCRPPFTNCATPQTRAEVKGVNYAVGIKDDISPEIDGIPWSSPSREVQTPTSNSRGGNREGLNGKAIQSRQLCAFHQSPAKLACKTTLRRLATIPPRSNASSLLRFDPMTDTKGYEGNPVLTPLELARQAHEAANSAYLKGLGKDPSAIHQGELKYVLPSDGLTITAARHVVQNAKVAEAYLQVGQGKRASNCMIGSQVLYMCEPVCVLCVLCIHDDGKEEYIHHFACSNHCTTFHPRNKQYTASRYNKPKDNMKPQDARG